MNFLDQRLPERFWSRVIPEPNSGCWLWISSLNDSGYGILGWGERKRMRAHRLAYLTLVGAIPDGQEIDHRCRVRCCVNPGHLEAVTHLVNMRRGTANAKAAEKRRSLTHCKHGHPFDGTNTYATKGGKRQCRECTRARHRDSYRKEQGQL